MTTTTPTDPTSLPGNIDMERSLLGCMLQSATAIGIAVDTLDGRDLYDPQHETIWDSITGLYAAGQPVDPITVFDDLNDRGLLRRLRDSPTYLATLIGYAPNPETAEYHARHIRDDAQRRRLMEAGTRIHQLGMQVDTCATVLLDKANSAIHDVTQQHGDRGYATMATVAEETIAELKAIADGDVAGLVSTGLTDLDDLLGGLHPGQMIVVAARPAIGKSLLATDIARNAAIRQDTSTLLFSLEMNRTEIGSRIAAAEEGINLSHMRQGTLDERDWNRMTDALTRVNEAPLYVDDTANVTTLHIKSTARRVQQTRGLGLIIVDYMQLIENSSGKGESRQVDVSEHSRQLKMLAKDLNVPVVVLAQLNRQAENRADKRPALTDIRESGAVEQDADVVIMLHREDAYDREAARIAEADLIVAKHRNGPTATATVAFQGHYARFANLAAPFQHG